MDRKAFFAALRKRDSGAFGTSLTQGQVDGCNALLDACEGWPVDHTAHVLAEVLHETGGGMLPVKETVYPYSKDRNPSDATVISRLDWAWSNGQLTWVKTPYWRAGWFGRGQIQLTHETNYRKASALVGVDLVRHPGKALDLALSAKIAAEGCRAGMFTGKKLADFDGPRGYDHINARAIVNGDRAKYGGTISKYAEAFTVALRAVSYGVTAPPADYVREPSPVPSKGIWAALLTILTSIFGKAKS